jgi:hypothetical protein
MRDITFRPTTTGLCMRGQTVHADRRAKWRWSWAEVAGIPFMSF